MPQLQWLCWDAARRRGIVSRHKVLSNVERLQQVLARAALHVLTHTGRDADAWVPRDTPLQLRCSASDRRQHPLYGERVMPCQNSKASTASEGLSTLGAEPGCHDHLLLRSSMCGTAVSCMRMCMVAAANGRGSAYQLRCTAADGSRTVVDLSGRCVVWAHHKYTPALVGAILVSMGY
jgi:hypothetical protein